MEVQLLDAGDSILPIWRKPIGIPMKKTFHFPIWAHFVGFAIMFFGWIGISYFLGGARTEAKLADSVIGALIFTILVAIVDGVAWGTVRKDR